MLPVLGKKAVLEWCMCERRFDWIIVFMSEMWKKYGIERKNGTKPSLHNYLLTTTPMALYKYRSSLAPGLPCNTPVSS
ncbi:hypothetical protein TNCV_2532761 [Trichonephila clavipes]|nr:hypothetical protein TNCV_2532761 [Trichonephila clavipes]